MKALTHQADFCVVGGGMAGLCAALAAARHGLKTVLMHDRPVLGGNASSEVRMWICGAGGLNHRETGLLEEIQLDNLYYNTHKSYAIWDGLLHGKLAAEPNLTLLLNCSCCEAAMEGNRIKSVTGWQLTSETRHTVAARHFADCSGDSILAPLTGAEFRIGREASAEYGEDIAPEEGDRKTMGLSCLLQARETDSPKPYRPLPWAHVFPDDSAFPHRPHRLEGNQNFWWLELGGESDSIHDTEAIRNELLKTAYGVWDHIKNRGDHGADNWVLEWVGFLPGKRESRRYLGDHVLTQGDVRAGGKFDDLVAYGGWSMDDHHPAGFRHPGKPTIFHPAPSAYGIPYRAVYSRNTANLFFAGRNISATHAAMSSTRVMATCALLGQAVGTAAVVAARHGLDPRGVYQQRIEDLQALLQEDDCWLPGRSRRVSPLAARAQLNASAGDPSPLRSGIDRPVADAPNSWTGAPGDWVEYRGPEVAQATELRLVCDSDLNRKAKNLPALRPLSLSPHQVPATLLRNFSLAAIDEGGNQRVVLLERDNFQRLRRLALPDLSGAKALRFIPESTWGAPEVRLFGLEIR